MRSSPRTRSLKRARDSDSFASDITTDTLVEFNKETSQFETIDRSKQAAHSSENSFSDISDPSVINVEVPDRKIKRQNKIFDSKNNNNNFIPSKAQNKKNKLFRISFLISKLIMWLVYIGIIAGLLVDTFSSTVLYEPKLQESEVILALEQLRSYCVESYTTPSTITICFFRGIIFTDSLNTINKPIHESQHYSKELSTSDRQVFISERICPIENNLDRPSYKKTIVTIECCHVSKQASYGDRVLKIPSSNSYNNSIASLSSPLALSINEISHSACESRIVICSRIICRSSAKDSPAAATAARSTMASSTASKIHSLQETISLSQQEQLVSKVKDMFYHAYKAYMKHGYPKGELRPISCEGGNFDLIKIPLVTLIDTLDTLVILGDFKEFRNAVQKIDDFLPNFDFDQNVSVFETTIRLLGGLLSAHLFAVDPVLAIYDAIDDKIVSSTAHEDGQDNVYNNCLLKLAVDIGERLLPAFSTRTGIPYGTVNLHHGVPKGETKIASTAGAGSLLIEFEVLSILSGEPKFGVAALKSMEGLFEKRSALDLVGKHINIETGQWQETLSGVGSNSDSFYEYLLKSYALLREKHIYKMFLHTYSSIKTHILINDEKFCDVDMFSGRLQRNRVENLDAFWPGLEASLGFSSFSSKQLNNLYSIWNDLGFLPEELEYAMWTSGQGAANPLYPLRPELIESTYHHYRTTGDKTWLLAGKRFFESIENFTRTGCGYASVQNMGSMELSDSMPSFFLSESIKYLFLLFDESNFIHNRPYIFSTEAHPYDVVQLHLLVRERQEQQAQQQAQSSALDSSGGDADRDRDKDRVSGSTDTEETQQEKRDDDVNRAQEEKAPAVGAAAVDNPEIKQIQKRIEAAKGELEKLRRSKRHHHHHHHSTSSAAAAAADDGADSDDLLEIPDVFLRCRIGPYWSAPSAYNDSFNGLLSSSSGDGAWLSAKAARAVERLSLLSGQLRVNSRSSGLRVPSDSAQMTQRQSDPQKKCRITADGVIVGDEGEDAGTGSAGKASSTSSLASSSSSPSSSPSPSPSSPAKARRNSRASPALKVVEINLGPLGVFEVKVFQDAFKVWNKADGRSLEISNVGRKAVLVREYGESAEDADSAVETSVAGRCTICRVAARALQTTGYYEDIWSRPCATANFGTQAPVDMQRELIVPSNFDLAMCSEVAPKPASTAFAATAPATATRASDKKKVASSSAGSSLLSSVAENSIKSWWKRSFESKLASARFDNPKKALSTASSETASPSPSAPVPDSSVTATAAAAAAASTSSSLPAPARSEISGTDLNDKIVLTYRGVCLFEEKATRAQLAGGAGLIIRNKENNLFVMAGKKDLEEFANEASDPSNNIIELGMEARSTKSSIDIPVVMLTEDHAQELVNLYQDNLDEAVVTALEIRSKHSLLQSHVMGGGRQYPKVWMSAHLIFVEGSGQWGAFFKSQGGDDWQMFIIANNDLQSSRLIPPIAISSRRGMSVSTNPSLMLPGAALYHYVIHRKCPNVLKVNTETGSVAIK